MATRLADIPVDPRVAQLERELDELQATLPALPQAELAGVIERARRLSRESKRRQNAHRTALGFVVRDEQWDRLERLFAGFRDLERRAVALESSLPVAGAWLIQRAAAAYQAGDVSEALALLDAAVMVQRGDALRWAVACRAFVSGEAWATGDGPCGPAP